MNLSGDIERFPEPEKVPEGWLSLTEAEAVEFETLPKALRIERYIKTHRTDKCVSCGGFLGNHSVKRFLRCAGEEIARRRQQRDRTSELAIRELVNG